ncbi:hypothetical protein VKS41_002004 [Umbelopsis sp. WA50703]|jgi:hypothetical protein
MFAAIVRNLLRVIQVIGALGTLICYSLEYTYINQYLALLNADTTMSMTTEFVPEVPSAIWFLVSAVSIIVSLVIASFAYRRVSRIKSIERALAFFSLIIWGLSVGTVFALDDQFYSFDDVDSPDDTSEAVYLVEHHLVLYADLTRGMALAALAGWTLGLLFSLLSDCLPIRRYSNDPEKDQLNEWATGANVTTTTEFSERYGPLPHHTAGTPPSRMRASSSYRHSTYKTPMEVANRSSMATQYLHHEDISSTHSWETNSHSSPRTSTHGIMTPPWAHIKPDYPPSPHYDIQSARGSYTYEYQDFPEIVTAPNHDKLEEENVSPTSFAYLITNPKSPISSLRRSKSLN